ncbi:ATP-binding protein [Rhodopseudomonas sp. NSM]|uniref:ATP-binding protein n=1 Tax=Rhodopseudomonas sp. NSM TaxID=3457630 RepID=UPI0040350166
MPENTAKSAAKTGGNATASGMEFQASVASLFGAHMLAGRQLDLRLGLGAAIPTLVRCETDAPVDDVLIGTSDGGYIFVQAKTNLAPSTKRDSPLGKSLSQAVRQWLVCRNGNSGKAWDRPLDPSTDRILIAIGSGSNLGFVGDITKGLERLHGQGESLITGAQQAAIDSASNLIIEVWKEVEGREPFATEISEILRLLRIVPFDFLGGDRTASIELMRSALANPESAEAAFEGLRQIFLRFMSTRRGADVSELRSQLEAAGVRLKALPAYRQDVLVLQNYSDRIRQHLEGYEKTEVDDLEIRIERSCTDAVMKAAGDASLLIVGEPGAGKSAVVSACAAKMRNAGYPVIELAVDRLPVSTLDGLRSELGLQNSVASVLANWPGGTEPAFLFIDALDAARGGRSEAVFRALISEVLSLPGKRWRVIASIRSFDLRMGEQFKRLFRGTPPFPEYADPLFSSVRHLKIPLWTDAELAQVLETSPPIATAIAEGGPRLRELALVPFNTRLLADLITNGVAAERFGEVGSQVQLLSLYWSNRVLKHGLNAELCLKSVVSEMVAIRGLRADRLKVAGATVPGLEALLGESVLIPVAGDKYVAFRHHILFDYAASRVFLVPDDQVSIAKLLKRESGLGLMLGPALVYSLQETWSHSGDGRDNFWRAICNIAGNAGCDPVARSVAARTACELPEGDKDFDGLIDALGKPEIAHNARTTVSQLIGSLSVRIEDQLPISVGAWSKFAKQLSRFIEMTAWPLRTLLFLLTERTLSDGQRADLGKAARCLLSYGLANPTADALTTAAIGFVGDTFASDPAESQTLLRKLFEPSRFEAHGHDDIPWLTRKIDQIARVRPEFAAEIFGVAFSKKVTDDSPTSLGNSRILSLTSNRRQDFEMAHWTLAQYLPKFFLLTPRFAARALVDSIRGYVEREHPIKEDSRRNSISIAHRQITLVQDWSYIWASNPEDEHEDNGQSLLRALLNYLASASPDAVSEVLEEIVARNEVAVLWARLLLAGVRRVNVLGKPLWPIATRQEFLTLSDTLKDSIDLVVAQYPFQPEEERSKFEAEALNFDFSWASNPEDARKIILGRIFGALGKDRLVTDEARRVLANLSESERGGAANERLSHTIVSSSEIDDEYWLRKQGADVSSPENARLIEETAKLKKDFHSNDDERSARDSGAEIDRLWTFIAEVDAATDVHEEVKSQAVGAVSDAFGKLIADEKRSGRNSLESLAKMSSLIERLAQDRAPQVLDDTERQFEESPSWGSPSPRIDVVEPLMTVLSTSPASLERLKPTLIALLADPHPAVRMAVAQRLNSLWNTDRPLMWQLIERVVSTEQNTSVLRFFASSVLLRLIHAAPNRVEDHVLALAERDEKRQAESGRELSEQIGGLMGLLWLLYAADRSQQTLKRWLTDPVRYDEQIRHAASMLRGAVILGYETGKEKDNQIRHRAHEMAWWIVDATASRFQKYIDTATEEDREAATAIGRILNHVCNQFYFSSGAFRTHNSDEDRGIAKAEDKLRFLTEVKHILERIAAVAMPETLHHLVELYEFLIPADPAAVFDLVANALLGAGKMFGYQFESLGADRVVAVVARFLADHKEIFEDDQRRGRLIECLDVFIEAGWPSARRLLYRLPELLQ